MLDGPMLLLAIARHSDVMQQAETCLRHKLGSAADRFRDDADEAFADARHQPGSRSRHAATPLCGRRACEHLQWLVGNARQSTYSSQRFTK